MNAVAPDTSHAGLTATAAGDPVKTSTPQIPPDRSLYRHMGLFFALSAIGLAIAGIVGEGLTWEGSRFFFSTVEHQNFYSPIGRYSIYPFQLPTVVISHFTSSVPLLGHVFGLSYAFAPFSALLACWLVVRKRAPRLMVWPVIGIIVVCFPTLLFLIGENPIAAEWAWPLILLTLLSLDDDWTLFAAALIALFLFFLAANSIGVFAIVAVIGLVRAIREPRLRKRLVAWTVTMVVAVPLEYVVRHRDFTAPGHRASLHLVQTELSGAEVGWPLAAYLLAACACAALLYMRYSARTPSRFIRLLPTGFVLAAGVCLAIYASDRSAWRQANLDRDVVFLLELPLIAVAAIDQLVGRTKVVSETRRAQAEASVRSPVLMALGAVLLVCLSIWAVQWSSEMHDVSTKISTLSTYCAPPASIRENNVEIKTINLEYLVLDLQGRTISHVILNKKGCDLLDNSGVLQMYDFNASIRNGWFHFKGTTTNVAAPVTPASSKAPLITRFSPSSGAVGSTITIRGKNLSAAIKITINGVPVHITKDKGHRIEFSIPAGAKSGPIVVTTPTGSVTSSSELKVT